MDFSSSAGNSSITGNRFSSALGLCEEFKEEDPHAVYLTWQLRRAQFQFLQQEADKATAVHLWDEQHQFSTLFLSTFCFHCLMFFPFHLQQRRGRETGPSGLHVVAHGARGGHFFFLLRYLLVHSL